MTSHAIDASTHTSDMIMGPTAMAISITKSTLQILKVGYRYVDFKTSKTVHLYSHFEKHV